MKHSTIATCPCGCGKSFPVEVDCDAPRHGKIGTGYHKAKEIKMLGITEQFAMEVLMDRHGPDHEPCYDWFSGLESRDVWKYALEYYDVNGIRRVTMNTIRRGLCYLQGLGFAKSAMNRLEVRDQESLEYKWRAQERWFATPEMRAAYRAFPKKPWPNPKEVQDVLVA